MGCVLLARAARVRELECSARDLGLRIDALPCSSRARVWYIVFGAILVRSGIHAAAHRYRYVQGGERRLVRLRWKVTPWAAVRAGPVQFCEIYIHIQ